MGLKLEQHTNYLAPQISERHGGISQSVHLGWGLRISPLPCAHVMLRLLVQGPQFENR